MGSNTDSPAIKQEHVERVALRFSDALNRENIVSGMHLQGDTVIKPLVKMESDIVKEEVKKEDPEIGEVRMEEALVAPASYTIYKSAEEIHYTPEDSLKEGLKMMKDIKERVRGLEIGNKLRKDVWLREIASLESQGSPSTMIAVCGATGAGKSSALNAILDDNIVPTSGMRACTAVVTEISYHKEPNIAADVSFLSEKEWKDELEVLLDDLVDEEGQFRRSTDLRSEAGVAWHKVHAIYPSLSQDRLAAIARRAANERVDAILNIDPKITKLMGTVKKIVSINSKEFAKQISKYIDSKDQKRGQKKDKEKRKEDNGPALWPLIRQVSVRCSSRALSTGAVLVDLPGVADANAARSSIARDYMKKADCVWILAPITRAVDDKTAKDLLGDAFKSQLMNGGFADVESTITFIATKCDDISCSEVINSLLLEDEPVLEEIEERLSQTNRDLKEWKRKKGDVEKLVKGITEELKVIRDDLAESREHLTALEEGRKFCPIKQTEPTKKRKNSNGDKSGSPKRRKEDMEEEDEIEMALDPDTEDSDLDDFIDDDSIKSADSDKDSKSSSSDEEDDDKSERNSVVSIAESIADSVSIDDVKAKFEEKKVELKNARERLSDARRQRKEAIDTISSLQKKQNKVQKDKNAFCSLKRSEFSRDVLKEDFRSGLKELDDAAEEKRNPAGFDPSVNLRNYSSIDLPVFTVSSRDYIRITKQVKGDGEPSCFSNIEESGVPDLQKWCHTLTIKSRERAARSFRNQLRVFATSIKSYIQGFDAVNEVDRTSLRQKWASTTEEDLYAISPDEDDDDPYGDNYDDGFEWVYDRGRMIPVARTVEKLPKDVTLVNAERRQGTGVVGRLCQEFQAITASCVESMQRAFKDGLEEKCQAGAEAAAGACVEISDAFAASMHWGTYRATLRRDGVWRRNLNEELISPMTKIIACSWAKTFENNLFSAFEITSLDAISKLLQEVEDSCPMGLRDRARHQSQLCLEGVKVALRKTVDVVNEELTSRQKDVSRYLEPHVRQQLSEGYSRAMEERGRGSVARQKEVFRRFVDTTKDDLFEDGAEVVLDGLDKIATDVGHALSASMDNLAEKIEVNLAVLWEAAEDSVHLVRERSEATKCVESILEQVILWEVADKSRSLPVRIED